MLPAGISYNTLLPFEIKYDNHSLPNYLYKDQIYAYHFFRLLQRAEDIVLLYNNVSDNALMEKSRFITQMEFLQKEKNLDNLQLEYPRVSFQFKASVPEDIKVKKTPEIQEKLSKMSYSATTLNNYINCPLQFYFKNVCQIEPRQTFQERIESNIIGTVVHALLQDVFDSIKDHPADRNKIIQEFLDHLQEKIDYKLLHDEELNLNLTPYDLSHGRIFLASRMVYNDVFNYLNLAAKELDAGNVEILGNELHLENFISLNDKQIKIHGYIDRLQANHPDGVKTIPVVVDYKTGWVSDDGLTLEPENLKKLTLDPNYKQMVQLLFYALLLKLSTREDLSSIRNCLEMQCGIICIKDSNKKLDYPEYWHPARLGNKKSSTDCITQEILTEFENLVKESLLEIITPEVPFEQTSDEKHCSYCDFQHICRKG